jgi:neurotrimin
LIQVGWVKADAKTIQAIHDTVITHNHRITISGDLYTTFNLHIAAAIEKDRGQYMCQINTDPMTYQVSLFNVRNESRIGRLIG